MEIIIWYWFILSGLWVVIYLSELLFWNIKHLNIFYILIFVISFIGVIHIYLKNNYE